MKRYKKEDLGVPYITLKNGKKERYQMKYGKLY
jgi:hypothetical protein